MDYGARGRLAEMLDIHEGRAQAWTPSRSRRSAAVGGVAAHPG